MKKLITKNFGVFNAQGFKNSVASLYANVYIMLGRSTNWANVSNSANLDDSFIPYPYDTAEYRNQIVKKGILLKRLTSADMQAVVPRTDWTTGTVYTAYDQTANLLIKTLDTAVTGATVNVANVIANTVRTTNLTSLNLATATPALSVGNFIRIGDERREIVFVNTKGDFLQVNSNFAIEYTQNTMYKSVESTYEYSNKFYVRNNLDQVFKCLFNNNNAQSTSKPEITLGGQLPENPYIETADGYRWKYLYTIPSGLKNRFFTERYMPVVSDPVVIRNAEDGRIDIVQIVNGGNGYFQGTTTNNYAIVDVTGDGTGAEFTVDVLNGVITEVNIVDGGSNYTNMTLTLNDPLKLPATSNGSLRAVISPPGGHGSNPASELGASDLMLSVDFQSDVDDFYPTKNDGTTDFRQVAIIKSPKLANGSFGFTSIYPMYTKLFVAAPSVAPYAIDSTVFVGDGGSFANSTFSATVIYFDSAENVLYVNDISGDVNTIDGETLYEKDNTSNYSQIFTITPPDINILSGELLYVENRSKIVRHPNQTETVKVVVEF